MLGFVFPFASKKNAIPSSCELTPKALFISLALYPSMFTENPFAVVKPIIEPPIPSLSP